MALPPAPSLTILTAPSPGRKRGNDGPNEWKKRRAVFGVSDGGEGGRREWRDWLIPHGRFAPTSVYREPHRAARARSDPAPGIWGGGFRATRFAVHAEPSMASCLMSELKLRPLKTSAHPSLTTLTAPLTGAQKREGWGTRRLGAEASGRHVS
jgi:hypothetical protein